MTETDYDTREKVNETKTGYELRITSKRGTGTRDQDEVSLTSRTETLDQIHQQRGHINAMVKSMMEQRRNHQPDGDDDE